MEVTMRGYRSAEPRMVLPVVLVAVIGASGCDPGVAAGSLGVTTHDGHLALIVRSCGDPIEKIFLRQSGQKHDLASWRIRSPRRGSLVSWPLEGPYPGSVVREGRVLPIKLRVGAQYELYGD